MLNNQSRNQLLDRIVAQVTLLLLSWVEKRIAQDKTAVDADVDLNRLRTAGNNIRAWVLKQQDGVRPRAESDENGSKQ